MIPAIGAPTNDVIPWHRTMIPKALVSLSRPIRSTRIMERSDTKQAAEEGQRHSIIPLMKSNYINGVYSKHLRIDYGST